MVSLEKNSQDKSKLIIRISEAVLLILLALSFFILLSLFSYHKTDPAWSVKSSHSIANLAGAYGAYTADLVLSFFGFFGYIFPLVLIGLVWALITGNKKENQTVSIKSKSYKIDWIMVLVKVAGCCLVLLSGSGLADVFFRTYSSYVPQGAGGIVGSVFRLNLFPKFSILGSILILISVLMIGITLVSGLSWVGVFKWSLLATGSCFKKSALGLRKLFSSNPKSMGSLKVSIPKKPFAPSSVQAKATNNAKAKISSSWFKKCAKLFKTKDSEQRLHPASFGDVNKPIFNQSKNKASQFDLSLEDLLKSNTKPASTRSIKESVKSSVFSSKSKAKVFKSMPRYDLLDKVDIPAEQMTDSQLQELASLLEQKLADFRIDAKVVGVCPGPVVTRFECQLAPGVKVSKLAGLSKDIARSLSAFSVRIVEVIPGKPYVGIELPNNSRQIVRLRDVLESDVFKKSESPLTIALGKDISGQASVADLTKMPHLLVAGTTGSGKSVGINAMIISLLYKCTPEQLRMIMIDPKMLELSAYEGIPHLLTPVVTQMNEAANSLRWCVKEMDRRYYLMSLLGVRNLASMNEKIKQAKASGTPLKDPINPEQDLEACPFIVVIVDEFADMMMTVGKKVEDLIARIAQKARAAGIHLILATQRPSVDVITGLIKANIPTRIAFQVSSKIDSRTILDQQGAESLLGNGDMLFLPPGIGVPTRVHGAFVADNEVHQVVKDWKSRAEPEYIDEIVKTYDPEEKGANGSGDAESDPMYDEAVSIVIETQRASISGIQRRLKVGYNRAARLIEQMEEAGLVGPMGQSGLREVLVNRQE
jgi:DNA segregation ATPase FtsK/SpoIIIE, S-DNA-T family